MMLIHPGSMNADMDSTDLFCGAGGSGLGAEAAGVTLWIAANHNPLAVQSHQANFPDCRHDLADISQVDPRRYKRTRILWGSPECTNHSGAKGKKRPLQGGLFGDEVDPHAERSRATMWDIPRFAEHHLYDIVIVENVVEAARWVMFDAWLMAMQALGYLHKIVYLNSMHAPAQKAPRAPQSRDRMYVVFWRKGNRAPDLDIRPLAWCPSCVQDVEAVQSWKKPDQPWGRYRSQYVYRCPRSQCRFSIVEPYADAAATAIDWSMSGQRIGDRAVPLKPKTLARIRTGLQRYGRAMTFEHRGNTFVRTDADGTARYARAWPVDQPTATLTTTETRALVVPVEGRDGKRAAPASFPMRTQSTRAETALVVPSGGTWNDDPRPTSEPFRARTTRETEALVVPYYGTAVARPATRELPTMGTVDTAGVAFIAELRGGGSESRPVTDPLCTVTASGNHHMLVEPQPPAWSDADLDELVEDCTFRMLEPSEIGRAMAFRPDYIVLGNRRDQVKQYGNAVTPPASEVLYRRCVASLEDVG